MSDANSKPILGRIARHCIDAVLPALPMLVAWRCFAPLGANPTNDDFLFRRSVQIWIEEGRFEMTSLNGVLDPSAAGLLGTSKRSPWAL